MKRKESVLSVRLPESLKEQIEKIAKATERPKSYFVKKALEMYLEEISDYAIALDRYTDKDAEYLTTEEVKREIGV
ncbi:MAG: ribbon-helix-helix protein, CopG family [Caldisericaceae bacterium]|nr:ribbon-helix-helix protein, CopG family [Caldisericaceae bacterium]